MPYVSSSGEIKEKQPWGLAKVVALFWGVLNFFVFFFQSLINPGGHSRGSQYSQDFRGPGQGAPVHHVTGNSDFQAHLRAAGSKLVVVDFFATWCGPCRMIAPQVEAMAAEMPNVVFLKVDVDECFDIASNYQVSAMPTFVFIKNNRKVDSFSGADVGKLRELVFRYQ